MLLPPPFTPLLILDVAENRMEGAQRFLSSGCSGTRPKCRESALKEDLPKFLDEQSEFLCAPTVEMCAAHCWCMLLRQ